MSVPGSSRWTATAVLPTDTSINPSRPTDATYYSPGQTAYVLFKMNEARTRPTRVITSFGPIQGWKLKTKIHLEHDQSGSYLGEYEIVGIHDFDTGESAGKIPDIKIKHSVVK